MVTEQRRKVDEELEKIVETIAILETHSPGIGLDVKLARACACFVMKHHADNLVEKE